MPLQNRVAPTGEIAADPARGTMMGNRGGRLHTPDRRLGSRRWASRQWICCVLSFRGRQRSVMGPNTYTELFFLDEATALAAGHRPCFECRRRDAVPFGKAIGRTVPPRAAEMDAILHRERLLPSGGKRTHAAPVSALPDGVMLSIDGRCHLLWGDRLRPWTFAGYGAPVSATGLAEVDVLTPRTVVAAIRCGYRPDVHPSARFAR